MVMGLERADSVQAFLPSPQRPPGSPAADARAAGAPGHAQQAPADRFEHSLGAGGAAGAEGEGAARRGAGQESASGRGGAAAGAHAPWRPQGSLSEGAEAASAAPLEPAAREAGSAQPSSSPGVHPMWGRAGRPPELAVDAGSSISTDGGGGPGPSADLGPSAAGAPTEASPGALAASLYARRRTTSEGEPSECAPAACPDAAREGSASAEPGAEGSAARASGAGHAGGPPEAAVGVGPRVEKPDTPFASPEPQSASPSPGAARGGDAGASPGATPAAGPGAGLEPGRPTGALALRRASERMRAALAAAGGPDGDGRGALGDADSDASSASFHTAASGQRLALANGGGHVRSASSESLAGLSEVGAGSPGAGREPAGGSPAAQRRAALRSQSGRAGAGPAGGGPASALQVRSPEAGRGTWCRSIRCPGAPAACLLAGGRRMPQPRASRSWRAACFSGAQALCLRCDSMSPSACKECSACGAECLASGAQQAFVAHLETERGRGRDTEGPGRAAQVVRAYLALPVPAPGEALEFAPDDGLQPVHFARPAAAEGARRAYAHRSAIAVAEAEAAAGLRPWAVAALCRALSLDNILTLLTCAARCGAGLR